MPTDHLLSKRSSFWTAFLLLLLLGPLAHAADLSLKRNQFAIGPEWYHLDRYKKGGTKQQGNCFGVRASYERLKRYKWYIGLEAAYSEGILKGHSGSDDRLKSRFSDSSAEGRFGYTFQQKCAYQLAFTPFIGGGYVTEKNKFKSPSPLPIHFRTNYPYVAGGFLLWGHFMPCWEAGLNFKVKYPLNVKCHVTNDPDNEPTTQRVVERFQYRVEVPITFRITPCGEWAITSSPFYESRYYGTHFNYPFDFFKTKLHMWGVTLYLVYRI